RPETRRFRAGPRDAPGRAPAPPLGWRSSNLPLHGPGDAISADGRAWPLAGRGIAATRRRRSKGLGGPLDDLLLDALLGERERARDRAAARSAVRDHDQLAQPEQICAADPLRVEPLAKACELRPQ